MHDDPSFFAVAHDPLLRLGADLHIVAGNPAAATLLATPTADLLGRSFAAAVHPDDRASIVAALTAADGAVAERSCRIFGSEGATRSLLLRFIKDPASGHILVSCRETTREHALRAERDDLRRRLAAVFATMADIVVTTDERGIFNGMNRPPPGLTLDHFIGVPMLSFAAPEEQAPMLARYNEVRAANELIVYETVAIFPDGTKESYSSRMGPIMHGDRSVGIVLISRNVTAERALEQAKRHAEQQTRAYLTQLERSNRELERFASIASHDLQEPLRKIQAFSDRLRDRFVAELPDAGRDYLERIRNAARRMQDLINDLLMFSRLSAGEQTHAPVNLMKVARSVLSDLEVRIEETGGEVVLGELPTIDADPVHMRQLLQNLVGNALKFTRPAVPPQIRITAELVPAHGELGELLRLRISDNGIGIEPRHHARIFGIFERLHARDQYEGTGVGLAVCHKIAEQHHGSIEVDSVIDEGTTFTVTLPTRQRESAIRPA